MTTDLEPNLEGLVPVPSNPRKVTPANPTSWQADPAHSFLLELVAEKHLRTSQHLKRRSTPIDVSMLQNTLDALRVKDSLAHVPKENIVASKSLDDFLTNRHFVYRYAPEVSIGYRDFEAMVKQAAKPTDVAIEGELMGFNPRREERWYRLSYPFFSADSNHVLIQISDLCPGLCGKGDIFLYSRTEDRHWERQSLISWLH